MNDLNTIADSIRERLVTKTDARDSAIKLSRETIRHCAESIRATHRREWDTAAEKLTVAREKADEMRAAITGYPDLYHSGYTQDALKEIVEAHCTGAIIRDTELPTPESLAVEPSTYLRGLAEAATELRRFILDILRRADADTAEAERLLDWMDSIYDQLVTFDFPDAITGGLRRQTDVVRGVLERTRGDLTTTIRQQRLQAALERVESRIEDEK
jgi:translin